MRGAKRQEAPDKKTKLVASAFFALVIINVINVV